MKTVKTRFYSFYAPYLINRDQSGYSDENLNECYDFLCKVCERTGLSRCSLSDDEYHYYGRPEINDIPLEEYPAGDVIEYIFY